MDIGRMLYSFAEFATRIYHFLVNALFSPSNEILPDFAWTVLYPVRLFIGDDTWAYIRTAPFYQTLILFAIELTILMALFKFVTDLIKAINVVDIPFLDDT